MFVDGLYSPWMDGYLIKFFSSYPICMVVDIGFLYIVVPISRVHNVHNLEFTFVRYAGVWGECARKPFCHVRNWTSTRIHLSLRVNLVLSTVKLAVDYCIRYFDL